MSSELIGVLGIVVLLLLMMLRLPVAFAMTAVGVAGCIVLATPQAGFSVLAKDIFEGFASYPLSVIPMFVLMGCFAFAAGISRRLFDTAYKWVGPYRGGLTIAAVVACSGFAAICGSTAATAATMGKVALPEMKRYGYDDSLASGTIAAAGTLGILIPPSTILIVYGFLTEQSIGKLFIAGVLPGILLSIFFILTVLFICWRNPKAGPSGAPTTWKEKFISVNGAIEALVIFGVAMGGLFAGWFSPTQAGAIGALLALIVGLIRRHLTWSAFKEACKDGILTSCMVLFIITGATIFGHFMAMSRIPFELVNWIASMGLSSLGVVILISIIFFVGGFFMDSMALVVLLIPIFFPLLINAGVDLIWFGVILVLLAEMGVITPPVGVNIFVIRGIAPEIPLERIIRGIVPFVVALILCLIVLIIFPQIVTFLPQFVSY